MEPQRPPMAILCYLMRYPLVLKKKKKSNLFPASSSSQTLQTQYEEPLVFLWKTVFKGVTSPF